MQPANQLISALSSKTGIARSTGYAWLNKADEAVLTSSEGYEIILSPAPPEACGRGSSPGGAGHVHEKRRPAGRSEWFEGRPFD